MGRRAKTTDEQIADTLDLTTVEAAALFHTSPGNICNRRKALRDRMYVGPSPDNTAVIRDEVPDGYVMFGSDGHYWPGPASTAHRAFVVLAHELQPEIVVAGGDMFDGARVSRWPIDAWDDLQARPTVIEELGAVQLRLGEIARAAPRAKRRWTMGNHDARFERYLIERAPELTGIKGTRLKDHFDDWAPCWEVRVNEGGPGMVALRHRHHNGVHAAYNNTMKAGVTMVTGHLHSLQCVRFSDYRGPRWGVDAGTLSALFGPHVIHYSEARAPNQASGFVVLTFERGRLLWPEMCHVVSEEDGLVSFRGRLMEV